MTEAMPYGTYQPPTGYNAIDVVITAVVLIPLLSAAWDIMVRAWRDEV